MGKKNFVNRTKVAIFAARNKKRNTMKRKDKTNVPVYRKTQHAATLHFTILFCASILCGCTTTIPVTSYGRFEDAVKGVAEELQKEGFVLAGVERDRKKETALSVRSYDIDNVPSTQSAGEVVATGGLRYGFQGGQASDYIYTDTYLFENDEGEKMRYAVTYRTGVDVKKGLVYVREVYTTGCETSSPTLGDKLCGEGSPIHRLDDMEKDTTAVL